MQCISSTITNNVLRTTTRHYTPCMQQRRTPQSISCTFRLPLCKLLRTQDVRSTRRLHDGLAARENHYRSSMPWLCTPGLQLPSLRGPTLLVRPHSHATPLDAQFATPLSDSRSAQSIPVSGTDSENLALASAMTTAQISRAAAQAIRLAIQRGQLRDAYYVVTSLRASWDAPGQGINGDLPTHKLRYPKFKPIPIGQRVSPRLAAHTLLHGLIRMGLSVKAARGAELLMKEGFSIRTMTLQSTIRILVPTPQPAEVFPVGVFKRPSCDSPNVLNLRPSMVSDPYTRYAVRLLIQAKRYRQRRTQDMFDFVIHMCLLQGELIVGSLLFAMLVRIMQGQLTFSAQMKMEAQAATTENNDVTKDKEAFRRRFNLRRDEWLVRHEVQLFPRKSLLHAILAAVESTLSQDPQDEESEQAFRASLQALANLAMLLDQRQLPYGDMSRLIRTLYHCPKVKDEVWIRRNGVPVRICAFSYFHQVLKRLISTLPSKNPPHVIKNPDKTSLLRPLNIASYNSLLHYSLRHRLSPALGNKVLNHMTKERSPPLEPDTTTYNIIIRSGTLLQKLDMTEDALLALRRRKENKDHGIMVRAPHDQESNFPSIVLSKAPEFSPGFSSTLRRLQVESLQLPADGTLSSPLKADSATLTSYITHLASTGQPHIVAIVLFRVLPELAIVDHPSWGSMSLAERQQMFKRSRQACLERSVRYGPYFFSAILNALRKAGKTGLAERVWLLAKQAERASWIDGFSPETTPWYLPVEAYTTMLQCYAAEAQIGLQMRRSNKNSYHTQFPRDVSNTQEWRPRMNKSQVRGWAWFILRKNQGEDRRNYSRRSAGQDLGILLFRSMRSGGREVYNSLMRIQRHAKSHLVSPYLVRPRPDARFFNAALELFSRRPHMFARGTRTKRPHWRRKLRFARLRYASLGTVSSDWNSFLQEIAEAMVQAGYSVPPGLRYIFVGRYMAGTIQFDRKELVRQPFAYPLPRGPAFRPHSLYTTKSRGLPIRTRSSPPNSR